MAAPVVTKIRVTYVRTRPRDTIGALPLVVVFQLPAQIPDSSPGYTRVFLTRVRRTRGRQTAYLLRRPQAVTTPPPLVVTRETRAKFWLFKPRPRRTNRSFLRLPTVVGTAVVVDQRRVRIRVQQVRTRPRRTIAHVFKPVLVGPFLPPPPPPPPPKRVQKVLGCGEYAAYVMLRGGQVFVGEVPWTSLQWSRVLDDTSTASVTAQVGLCSDVMTAARPWEHELVIFRSGELVWAGPIFQVVGDPESPSISARDLSGWWDRRVVHHTLDFLNDGLGADLAVIFQAIHDDAMKPDNSPGFTIETETTGIIGTNQVFVDQRTLAGSVLRDLAQAGIDWTVVGRSGHAGGKVIPGDLIAPLLDDTHFLSPPRVTYDGSTKANKEYVQGSGSDDVGLPIEGIATDDDAALVSGLLEQVESVSTIFNDKAALASAQSKLALNLEPFTVDEAVLAPTAPLLISDLVPGRLVQFVLQETVVRVVGQARLQSVDVQVSADGEAVGIVCQPLGTT